MNRIDFRPSLLMTFALALATSIVAAADEPKSATPKLASETTDFFERKIRPVLVEHCYRCHSADSGDVKGGLRVDDRDAMRAGGDSGAGIIPGDIDESLVLSAIKYDSFEMPPDQKLPERVILDFEKWIQSGAVDPRDSIEPSTNEPASNSVIDFQEGRQFWSFQPPRKQPAPDVAHHDLIQGKIDRFVEAKLEDNGLRLSRAASTEELLRRLSFDLTGLPPDLDWINRHEELNSAAGIANYVDHLLSSNAFGEHFARGWMDLMRYADDQAHIVGNNTALCYPNAYLYRDWVIDALNQDTPYDEFIRLQLAADLATPENPADDVALGFIGLGPKYYRRNSPEVKADELEDRIDVLSRSLLGLTVACARCHDHKYDPIATTDYYALAGVFASIEMFNQPLDESRELNGKGHTKKPEDALHVVREKKIEDQFVAIRGDVKRKGSKVPRGYLTVLTPATVPSEDQRGQDSSRIEFQNNSGRLQLADQLVAPGNPLTARVIVNRIWGRLIGKPLVGTPSNFGSLGDRPSHPELLDDLAVRFMENGWSIKWLCREIVSSRTYQQTSESTTQQAQQDPENHWLSHMHRKRLSIEQWRDAMLVASRNLNDGDRTEHTDPSDPASVRRTIYSDVSRLKLNPMLALFDFPDPNAHSGQRAETTTAAQKLFLMNSPFMVHVASSLNAQLSDLETAPMIQEVYQRLYGRSPTPIELEVGERFLSNESGTRQEFIHALAMANEMFFVD